MHYTNSRLPLPLPSSFLVSRYNLHFAGGLPQIRRQSYYYCVCGADADSVLFGGQGGPCLPVAIHSSSETFY